jgi:hypothetical protein
VGKLIDPDNLSDLVRAITSAWGKHGITALQAEIDRQARGEKGRPRKWTDDRLLHLWIVVKVWVGIWQKKNNVQPSSRHIDPALKAVFANKRQRAAFLECIEPGRPDLDTALLDLTVKTTRNHYYEANRLMKEWKKAGDKRYAYAQRCLKWSKETDPSSSKVSA